MRAAPLIHPNQIGGKRSDDGRLRKLERQYAMLLQRVEALEAKVSNPKPKPRGRPRKAIEDDNAQAPDVFP